jgi:hypothetical protein
MAVSCEVSRTIVVDPGWRAAFARRCPESLAWGWNEPADGQRQRVERILETRPAPGKRKLFLSAHRVFL